MFKIGDRVTVRRPCEDKELYGMTGTVVEILENTGYPLAVKFDELAGEHAFADDEIQLAA